MSAIGDTVGDAMTRVGAAVTGKTPVYRGEPSDDAFTNLLEDADEVYFNRARSDELGDTLVDASQVMEREFEDTWEKVKFYAWASKSDFAKTKGLTGEEAADAYRADHIPADVEPELEVYESGGNLEFEFTAEWREDVEDTLSEKEKAKRTYEGRIHDVVDRHGQINAYMQELGFDDEELLV